MAIVGTVKWFGQKRDTMSRLRAVAYKGDREIRVYPNLDWKSGDKIALLPTAVQWLHMDYNEIESYDSTTGIVTLKNSLSHYHWGQSASTEYSYAGVDMRGEVVMLSRNVRFVGNNTDAWGGQIVVSDNYEYDWGIQRSGQIHFDYVEVYNCSQRDTYKSAIRFQMAETNPQVINNTAIHGNLGWALSSQFSSHIHVDRTHMIHSFALGLVVFRSNNVTIDNSIVAGVRRRTSFSG